MIESLLPVESLLHIDCEESTDQVFAFVRDEVELVMVEMIVSILYLVFGNGLFPLKWKLARDDSIKNDSEGPNVCLFTLDAAEYFWGHVLLIIFLSKLLLEKNSKKLKLHANQTLSENLNMFK